MAKHIGYAEITLDEFVDFIYKNYKKAEIIEPKYSNEFTFDIHTTSPNVVVRVYSSILKTRGIARGVGEDAIRVVLYNTDVKRPIAPKQKRVHRMSNWRIHLKSRIDNLVKNSSNYNKFCPKCKSPLIVRTAGKTGNEFLGCSAFPNCTYTENITGEKSATTKSSKKKRHFTAEISDFGKNYPSCKNCGNTMYTIKTHKDKEGAITHWDSLCKVCGMTATIFND